MRKPCIPDLIYQKTFPKPKQGEPVSFYAHIQRHIVSEVRIEVQTYYGALDTLEAQYPGLDYTHASHRRRLSRHTWHRRLFRAFDELGLTTDEILNLCQWEGTRAAKERYEREARTEVLTTTGDDIVPAPKGSGPKAVFEDWTMSPSEQRSESGTVLQVDGTEESESSDNQHLGDSPSSSPTTGLFGLLRDAMEARDSSAISQAWEQWLKEALERSETDLETVLNAIGIFEPGVRGADDTTEAVGVLSSTTPLSPPPVTQPRQTHNYDELHTLVGELQNNNTRLAADNAALALFLRRSQAEAAR